MTYFEGRGIFSITMPPDSVVQNGNRSPPFPRRKSKKSKKNQQIQETNSINSEDDYEDELRNWVTRALNGEDISKIKPEMVPDLVRELNNQWELNVAHGYYFESEFAYKAFKSAQELQKSINDKKLQKTIKDDLKNRKDQTKARIKDLDDMVQVQRENMEKEFANEINQLMDKHDKEIKQFNEKWNTVKQRLYNKPSAQLNLLQRAEDKLSDTRRYYESFLVSKEVDKLKKIESREKAIKMEYDYRETLSTLIQKQREEMRVLLSNHEDIRKLHQGAKQCEEDLIDVRLKKIDRETEKANDMATIQRRQLKYSRGLDEPSKCSLNTFSRTNNKDVIVSEFNEVPLPPLDAERKIKRAITRRSAALSPSQKKDFQYNYDYQISPAESFSLSMSLPRTGSTVSPNQQTMPKSQSQSNSPRGKINQRRQETNYFV